MGILEIKQLYKRFGHHEVLKGLDMDVPEHSILVLSGRMAQAKRQQ
jgi:ABC-type sugar transport systems, ATPase components